MRRFPTLLAVGLGAWALTAAASLADDPTRDQTDRGELRLPSGIETAPREGEKTQLRRQVHGTTDLIVHPGESPTAHRSAQLEQRLERLERRTEQMLERLETLAERPASGPRISQRERRAAPPPAARAPARPKPSRPFLDPTAAAPLKPAQRPARLEAARELEALEQQIQRLGRQLQERQEALATLQGDVEFSQRYLEVLRRQHGQLQSLLQQPPQPVGEPPMLRDTTPAVPPATSRPNTLSAPSEAAPIE